MYTTLSVADKMQALSTTGGTHLNGTHWHRPQHGPFYGFYIRIEVLTAIVASAWVCCWRVNNDRRGRCKQRVQPEKCTGRAFNPPENMTEPEPAYFPSSRETLPLYHQEHDFRNQPLQARMKPESPVGTRPPSYRSRRTLDLEVAVKDSVTDDGHSQRENDKGVLETDRVDDTRLRSLSDLQLVCMYVQPGASRSS